MALVKCRKCGETFGCDENVCQTVQKLREEIDHFKAEINSLNSERKKAWMLYHTKW
jgi:uncharacterized phage-like protein YoqJ